MCARCADAGMKCDGYPSSVKSNLDKQRQNEASLTYHASASASITTYAIPFQIPGSQKDRQMLHYLCVQACHDLSGYLSSDFWSRVVLKCSHTQPVVRHALVALSSIHLEYVHQDSTGGRLSGQVIQNTETLLQYNRAVRQLRKYIASTAVPSIIVALTCCALFYCFESTRGDYDSAREHLRSGLVILQSTKANGTDKKLSCEPTDSHDDLEQLSRIFSRLDLQASMFDDARTPFFQLISAEERCGAIPAIPNTFFRDLEEAQVTLVKLQNHLLNFLTRNNRYKFVSAEDLPNSIVQEKRELLKQFKRWSLALEDFLKWHSETKAGTQQAQSDPEINKKLQRGIAILQIYHRLALMFVSGSFPDDNSPFAASPNPDADLILELAESLVQNPGQNTAATAAASASPRLPRSFSSEMGVVAPLFLLALKCQDQHVCDKAVALLVASNRREGLIDAQMVLGILERAATLKRKEEITPMVAMAAKMPLEIWITDVLDTVGGLESVANVLDTLS